VPSGSNINLATAMSQSTLSPANGRRSGRLATMTLRFPVVPGRGANGWALGWPCVGVGSKSKTFRLIRRYSMGDRVLGWRRRFFFTAGRVFFVVVVIFLEGPIAVLRGRDERRKSVISRMFARGSLPVQSG
jgi:hypothetical protein